MIMIEQQGSDGEEGRGKEVSKGQAFSVLTKTKTDNTNNHKTPAATPKTSLPPPHA